MEKNCAAEEAEVKLNYFIEFDICHGKNGEFSFSAKSGLAAKQIFKRYFKFYKATLFDSDFRVMAEANGGAPKMIKYFYLNSRLERYDPIEICVLQEKKGDVQTHIWLEQCGVNLDQFCRDHGSEDWEEMEFYTESELFDYWKKTYGEDVIDDE